MRVNGGHGSSRSGRISRSRRVLVALTAVLFVAGGPAWAADPVAPDDIQGPYQWGGVANVTRLHHLWFAGQPDSKAFQVAKENGIQVVLNLRAPGEIAWDEKPVVEGLGMTYYNVPVTGPTFSAEAFAQIEKIVESHHPDHVLIHCASSNRVGGWLATHLVKRHDMTVDEAIAVGRKAGITKTGIEERARSYLAENAGK